MAQLRSMGEADTSSWPRLAKFEVYFIELALIGDCRSELNDLSEDFSLLGLHDSLELLTTSFAGLASMDLLFLNESSMLTGVVELDISYIFLASVLHPLSFVPSESTERSTNVFESELTDEHTDLSMEKSRESDPTGLLGLTVKLDGFESGPIVSPELNDLLLSGVLAGLLARSTAYVFVWSDCIWMRSYDTIFSNEVSNEVEPTVCVLSMGDVSSFVLATG